MSCPGNHFQEYISNGDTKASTCSFVRNHPPKKTAEPKTNIAVLTPQGTQGKSTQVTEIEEAIRVRAYQLWEHRGHPYGSAMEDWLQAETEVVSVEGARTA